MYNELWSGSSIDICQKHRKRLINSIWWTYWKWNNKYYHYYWEIFVTILYATQLQLLYCYCLLKPYNCTGMISQYFVYKVQLIIIPIQFLLSLPLHNIHTFKVFNFFINTSMPQHVLKFYSDHYKFFLFYINVLSRYVYLHIFCVFSQQAANIYTCICTSEEQEMPLGMCTQCI